MLLVFIIESLYIGAGVCKTYTLKSGIIDGLVYDCLATIGVDFNIVVNDWWGGTKSGVTPGAELEGILCLG